MKHMKWLLLFFVGISAFFQLAMGVWMLVDVGSAAELMLGLQGNPDLIQSWEFDLMAKLGGKSFLMLAGYSFITMIMIVKSGKSAFLLSLATGSMILLISFATFVETGSPLALLSDGLRGGLIILFAFLYRRYQSLSPRVAV